jgi:hypothetical protein
VLFVVSGLGGPGQELLFVVDAEEVAMSRLFVGIWLRDFL